MDKFYKNIYSFESIFGGLKSIGLTCCDLTHMPMDVDVLVIAANKGSYRPISGTLIKSLLDVGIDVNNLSYNAEIDMRGSNGVWLSKPTGNRNIKRIACVEFKKYRENITREKIEEKITSLFSLLAAANHAKMNINRVAMPLLGSGKMNISPEQIMEILLKECKRGLEDLKELNQINISVINTQYAELLSEAMNKYLGRTNAEMAYIPLDEHYEFMITKIIEDLQKIVTIRSSTKYKMYQNHKDIITEIIQILKNAHEHKGFELEILSRRLLEVMINDLSKTRNQITTNGVSNLCNNIDKLAKDLKMAKWIAMYMHIVRVLGNSAAHGQEDDEHIPSKLEENDLRILLECLIAIVPYWKNTILKDE